MAGDQTQVGVLALQGDVREHAAALRSVGAEAVLVRTPGDLEAVDGLVIPGGESSVIDKLSKLFGVREPIRAAIASGMPALGTCAGLILLADEVLGAIDGQDSFGGLDIAVRRNAFGSQVESFEVALRVDALGDPPVHATFIRAPVVERVGSGVHVLASLPGGEVIAVEQGSVVGMSFHPEMNGELRFHARLVDEVRRRSGR